MVKFDKASLIDFLKLSDFRDEVELTIMGELVGGTLFEGSDTIRVMDNS